MKNYIILIFSVIVLTIQFSCKEQITNQNEDRNLISVKTVLIKKGNIESTINFNGKTVYLKKNTLFSPISGYIVKINVRFGDLIQKDDILYEIQTRENKALENTNSYNEKNGIIKVLASSSGIINELNVSETGGYSSEGGILCSIAETKDLMVQINAPFEYNSILKPGTNCKIFLSDNTTFEGNIYKALPVINESDQTQNILVKPNNYRQLPENLNLTVQFINAKHNSSYLVSKEAVMTNETQTDFWVMKITNLNLAIKIPIIKGIENDSIVEVISSNLNINDLVISEGAYGLQDSTVVNIVK